MSIFPFINTTIQDATETSSAYTPREYAWDFTNNYFLMKDGKFIVLEGLEAIKVWTYKALGTQRYRYLAYSWNYGQELEDLIGEESLSKQALESEVKRYVGEALLIHPNIKGIKNLKITIDESVLSLEFTIITDYGEAMISV